MHVYYHEPARRGLLRIELRSLASAAAGSSLGSGAAPPPWGGELWTSEGH